MKPSLEQLKEEFLYEKTNRCVQCGYCLPVCPTYVTMRKETHSPRGRIHLIKMVGEGKITDLSALEQPLDLCLGCRACETACPTGVEYGSILEAARAAMAKRKKAFRSGPFAAESIAEKSHSKSSHDEMVRKCILVL